MPAATLTAKPTQAGGLKGIDDIWVVWARGGGDQTNTGGRNRSCFLAEGEQKHNRNCPARLGDLVIVRSGARVASFLVRLGLFLFVSVCFALFCIVPAWFALFCFVSHRFTLFWFGLLCVALC